VVRGLTRAPESRFVPVCGRNWTITIVVIVYLRLPVNPTTVALTFLLVVLGSPAAGV